MAETSTGTSETVSSANEGPSGNSLVALVIGVLLLVAAPQQVVEREWRWVASLVDSSGADPDRAQLLTLLWSLVVNFLLFVGIVFVIVFVFVRLVIGIPLGQLLRGKAPADAVSRPQAAEAGRLEGLQAFTARMLAWTAVIFAGVAVTRWTERDVSIARAIAFALCCVVVSRWIRRTAVRPSVAAGLDSPIPTAPKARAAELSATAATMEWRAADAGEHGVANGFIALALIPGVIAGILLWRELEASTWPSIDATVVESVLAPARTSEGRPVLAVTFRYEINGAEYHAARGIQVTDSNANGLGARYARGTSHVIRANPDSPSTIRHDAGWQQSPYGFVVLAGMFALGFLALGFLLRRDLGLPAGSPGRRTDVERAAAEADERFRPRV